MSGVVQDAGGYKRITATTNICPNPSILYRCVVASTTSGTVQFYDSATTGTTTPITGVITPAAGATLTIGAATSAGIYCVVTGTIDCTVIFV